MIELKDWKLDRSVFRYKNITVCYYDFFWHVKVDNIKVKDADFYVLEGALKYASKLALELE